MLGSIAGLAVGYVVLRGLLVAAGAPPWLDAAPDWRVVIFALAAGLASAILFGLTPALQVGRQHHRTIFARQVLIGAQVAASCVLMIVAGLLSRALDHASSTDPGFTYRQVVSIDPGLSGHSYSPARARAYLDSLQDRLRAVPGVQSISLAISPPLGHVTISAGIDVDGRPVGMQLNHVDSRFFDTMKIALLRGRNLKPGDSHVAVISESMARLAWPEQDALGKTFTLGQPFTVVGICGSVRLAKFGDSDSVQAYLPVEPGDQTALNILVRTAASPQDLARAAVAASRAVDAEAIPDVQLLSTAFRTRLEGAEYSAWAVSVLGFIAHLLACLGIAGVVAYAVSQRTKEIGIRMALGAQASHVLSVVLRQFSRPVVAGLIVGLAGAAALSQVLRGRLYGISNFDPATYLIAIVVFLVTVTIAAILPARRALRIDPLRALRHE
jgi:predicted permease